MIKLQIFNAENRSVYEAEGEEINVLYGGELTEGYKIKARADGVRFLRVQLDELLKESDVFIPNGTFEYILPSKRELDAGYAQGVFQGKEHSIRICETQNPYKYRNLALNPYDLRGRGKYFPHASANFVTREEPCFYERNAIDGEIHTQGHGGYPYHSWAGGAREDLEYTIQLGKIAEVDKLAFYLRADFNKSETGEPHDSYWKSIDIEFSNGETITAEFNLDRETFPNIDNEKGIEITFPKIETDTIKLKNFKQVTKILSFAALTQIEVYGRYVKEDFSKMEVRQASNAKDVKHYTTERLREEFHIANLFTKDNVRMVYSHIDRIITAGFMPVKQTLKLEAGKELAADYFLQRREMGCINIGGKGIIMVDGTEYEMNPRDGMYIGMGNKEITFKSVDENAPAKFYVSSCPAHTTYPTVKIDITKAKKVPCGSAEDCNKRVINQYIHPEVMKSCQLSMGLTQLESGSNWNTMPCHTHDRRMEVYLYLDMGENDVVFHMMGEPTETRHIIMHNEEAVISPSWSIHSGVGTKAYSFIWAMCGENQEFTDMDHIATKDLL